MLEMPPPSRPTERNPRYDTDYKQTLDHTMPIISSDCLNVISSLQLLERLIAGIASSFTHLGVASGVAGLTGIQTSMV